MVSALAAWAVGTFFLCAGWNKLAHVRRTREMRMVMQGLYGPRLGTILAQWIPILQVACGAGLLFGMYSPTSRAIFALPLLAICAEGFRRVGLPNMRRTWRPDGLIDNISCWLYSPDVLLAILCVLAILGTP